MMPLSTSLNQKIEHWCHETSKQLVVNGIDAAQWSFFFYLATQVKNSMWSKLSHVLVTPDASAAEELYHHLKPTYANLLFYPGLEVNPYYDAWSPEVNQLKRFFCLDRLCFTDSPKIIVTDIESLCLKTAPRSYFKDNAFNLRTTDIISPFELKQKLVSLGYQSSISVEEPGHFSHKGEIFDLYPVSDLPVRITYFDDMIEEIWEIDPETQMSNRNISLDSIHITPNFRSLVQAPYATTLRENIPMPRPNHKNRFDKRKSVFEHIRENRLFENFHCYIPLFFTEAESLLDYLSPDSSVITFIEENTCYQHYTEQFEEFRTLYETSQEDRSNDSILPHPSSLFLENPQNHLAKFKRIGLNRINLEFELSKKCAEHVRLHIEGLNNYLAKFFSTKSGRQQYIQNLFSHLSEKFKHSGQIVFTLKNESLEQEVRQWLEKANLSSEVYSRIQFIRVDLNHGFYYDNDKLLVISENDLFSRKIKKTKTASKKKIDLFADQLSTLKKGDYVIHSTHGIGQYNGLVSLPVDQDQADFIELVYSDGDKIYVPIYKLELVQKHSNDTAQVKLASLRSNKFEQAKSRAKNAVKKLAFDLLRLQAERNASQSFAFSEPGEEYRDFELAFPFKETIDQAHAISDVISDMQKEKSMDRLVCGDVGFGKTEVAMRAAFLSVVDQKQVAILVPTTVLALQHYNSFVKRFKNFPVNINFLSRFKSPKEVNVICDQLEEGKIDILIGTHKLLSSKVKFKDLGLVIVDEEQRFGVAHKEKLKLFKANVDFLTLTATPIPRTLQMAFLGIRDLSLIQTAPPKRQSIKTYIVKDNDYVVAEAIQKEINRGGQVFYVHNRVQDIELVANKIRELVPRIKIMIAHGQLAEKELERRMASFYSGEFDILISTTIIESGIDIPNANTMIIHNANRFGLSQLHQLRGRIGRSDRKAYAYFLIPKNLKLTEVAEKRLQALQNYADMGSGFSIASSDLEIRGAGDILGAEQSGHIESIGLELYIDLLKDAVAEIKGERVVHKKDIEIVLPIPHYIPKHYIADSAERLRYYKKLSNCISSDEVDQIALELEDIFGPYSSEVETLLSVIKAKIDLRKLGVKTLKTAGKTITLNFDQNTFEADQELRNSVVNFFTSRPKIYQITPNYSVIIKTKERVNAQSLTQFSKEIAQQIVPW